MSKHGPRIKQEERLAIVQEGEKTSFNAVCAKYNISPQTYRRWRYAARGIKPKPSRHFSPQQKLEILEEGYQRGIGVACKRWGINPAVYHYWKHKFHYTKSRPRCLHTHPRFSTEKKLAILKEGESTSASAVVRKYGFHSDTYAVWRYRLKGIPPKKRIKDRRWMLKILEDGAKYNVARTCAKHGISKTTYRRFKRRLGFKKSPGRTFSQKEQ